MLALRRLVLKDMDAAAAVHRASFDRALPWLADCTRQRRIARSTGPGVREVWGAERQSKLVGIIAFRLDWIDQSMCFPSAGHGVGACCWSPRVLSRC
jgi:hypothetical protein